MDPEAKKHTAAGGLRDLVLYFLRLGALGFGGPIALVGYMQRNLVEDRRWITQEEYTEGLALAQLSPGPLAAQLSIYLGWVKGGIIGSNLVGVAFILPSFLMVVALGMLYLHYGGLPWMRGVFYGVGAAVIAVIARSAVKLVQKNLGKDRLLWALFIVSALVTVWTQSEIVWIFLACGAASVLIKTPPKILKSGSAQLFIAGWPAALFVGLHGLAPAGTLWKIAWYFTKAGAFVFGSGDRSRQARDRRHLNRTHRISDARPPGESQENTRADPHTRGGNCWVDSRRTWCLSADFPQLRPIPHGLADLPPTIPSSVKTVPNGGNSGGS